MYKQQYIYVLHRNKCNLPSSPPPCTHTLQLPSHTKLNVVGPEFAQTRYDGTEGADLAVRLSASSLTSIPITFTGSIEVDITAEDTPGGATFGKQQFSLCNW